MGVQGRVAYLMLPYSDRLLEPVGQGLQSGVVHLLQVLLTYRCHWPQAYYI